MNNPLQSAMREYQAGRLSQALKIARSGIGKAGSNEGALLSLIGNIHYKQGEKVEAADAFARAARRSGDKASDLLKLAVTLYNQEGRADKIAEVGPGAVSLNPQDSDFAFLVGNACFAGGRLAEMEPVLAKLDRTNDRHMALIINYYRLAGRFEELYAELQAAVEADPHNGFLQMSRYAVAREVCDFKAMREHEAIMRTPDVQPAPRLLSGEAALGRILWSDDEAINARPCQETGKYAHTLAPGGRMPRRAFSPAGGKITIGYLSNDFFDHATMTLLREALARHDREKFDVVLLCYTERNAAAQQQKWPQHLRESVVPVGHLSDQGVADLIRERGIDILVDLKGHTMGARLGIVNLSDAPVKATYLGFPGSVGGVDLDYAITDPVVTPDTSKPFYSEKLCRLPETYQANNWQTRPLPQPVERAAHGLPEDAFVFGSFNATYKISPRTLDLWVRVLKAVPDSVFWLLCPVAYAQRNLLAALEDAGIARSRIVMTGRIPYPAHISRLPLADIGLDTFPYNGHTTTSDMLWAGLPVLALDGKSFAGRVSASLLKAAGLPELVVPDEDAYCDLAVRLAEDPQLLSAFRQRLEAARFRSPLFDNERFVRHLEAAYEMMAERARAGQLPDHIDVPALPQRSEPFGHAP